MQDTSKNLRQLSTQRRRRDATTEQAFSRVPPQAVPLEEAVLGAILIDSDAISNVIEFLKPACFYDRRNELIFEAAKLLFEKHQPVDLLTVTEELKRNNNLEEAGGNFHVAELTSKVTSSANVEYHARIIAEKYILREMIAISSRIQTDAFEDSADVFDLLDKAESELFDISQSYLSRSYQRMSSVVHEAYMELDRISKIEGGMQGVPSGFSNLDRITSGWQKSDLIILAARPSMGKTALALQLARNAAVDYNQGVAIFSLEMSTNQLANRLLSMEAEINGGKLKNADMAPHEWEQLRQSVERLGSAPIFIDDTPGINIFELRAKCRRLKKQHDIKLIVVDYLQLMTGPSDKRSSSREQEISQISRSLKGLAKELEVPVIALSQLSREVEKRGGAKRPVLSDLRESGAIEQDADIVAFIYRPEYYDLGAQGEHMDTPDGYSPGESSILISKHRNGPTGDARVRFQKDFAKFEDWDGDLTDASNLILGSRMNSDDIDSFGSSQDPTPF